MKKTDFLKLASVAVLTSGLMIGCASKEEPAPEPEVMAKECPSAAAKNAIYSAKVKLARAKKLGYEWRDTAQMIDDAEKAGEACDNDKAIALANQAAEQAEDAIAQYNAEAKRYAAEQDAMRFAEMEAHQEYTVVSGDNLWDISAMDDIYGNPYQWPLIYKANSDQITDADLIYSGQVFSIPTGSSAEVDAAVQHARNRGAWSIGDVEASDQDYLAQ